MMFYVLSLMCVESNGIRHLAGVRFFDTERGLIFDRDLVSLVEVRKDFKLSTPTKRYVDVLIESGDRLVTEFEAQNPKLNIPDFSKDVYTSALMLVTNCTFQLSYREAYEKARGNEEKLREFHLATTEKLSGKPVKSGKNNDIFYEFEHSGVAFYQSGSGVSMLIATCRGTNYVMQGQTRREFPNMLASFESAFNARWGTSYDMASIMAQAKVEAGKQGQLKKRRENLLRESVKRAKDLQQSFMDSLPWEGQSQVGAFSEYKGKGYVINIPYRKVHVFNLTDDYEVSVFEDLKEGVLDRTWCRCGYTGIDVTYVENYKGESHVYICPKCKRYVQIG